MDDIRRCLLKHKISPNKFNAANTFIFVLAFPTIAPAGSFSFSTWSAERASAASMHKSMISSVALSAYRLSVRNRSISFSMSITFPPPAAHQRPSSIGRTDLG